MVITKAESVRILKGFIEKTYDSLKSGGEVFKKNGDPVPLKGIVFINNSAYFTNGHYAGRLMTNDNRPATDSLFYDLSSGQTRESLNITEVDNNDKKQLSFFSLENNEVMDVSEFGIDDLLKSVRRLFFDVRDSSVYINPNDIVEFMDKHFGRKENDKKTRALHIRTGELGQFMRLMKSTRKKDGISEYERLNSVKSEMEEKGLVRSKCVQNEEINFFINAYYAYEIFSLFKKYDRVKISYSKNPRTPIMIESSSKELPELSLAVCQFIPTYIMKDYFN